MGQTGRPSAIVRLDTATLTFADVYVLPPGAMAGSLQLVPNGGGGATDGYLVGTIFTDARTELWIFDAAQLAAGPSCKLASPDWRIGFRSTPRGARRSRRGRRRTCARRGTISRAPS